MVAAEHKNLLVANCHSTDVLQLLPLNINADRLQGEVVHTEELAFFDRLFAVATASHN